MYLFDTQDPTTVLINLLPEIIKSAALILVSGGAAWIFARKKNAAETGSLLAGTHKTESDVIQNYLNITSDLQDQIKSWVIQVKELRSEASKSDEEREEVIAEKDALKRELKSVKENHEIILKERQIVDKKERAALIDMIDRMLLVSNSVLDNDTLHPQCSGLRREIVRSIEMMYYLKNKLKGETK